MSVEVLPADFFDSQCDAINPLRRYWNRGRQKLTARLVEENHSSGPILDIGCGNVVWNSSKRFEVIGIDQSTCILDYTRQLGRIRDAILYDVTEGIPLSDNTVHTVVMTEMMEHIEDTKSLLDEVCRVLKPVGHLILSVPFSGPLSMWNWLYPLSVFWHGRVLKQSHYLDDVEKEHNVHIHRWTVDSLTSVLNRCSFDTVFVRVYLRMTLFVVARRS